jgi:hypothetical protein
MAARAADVPAFAVFLGKNYEVYQVKADHIRRFGNILDLKSYLAELST